MNATIANPPAATGVPTANIGAFARQHYIGCFARSIETGWPGKVIAIEGEEIDTMCRMHGVNDLYRAIKGGDIEDAIEASDVQWFSPYDLRFLKLV